MSSVTLQHVTKTFPNGFKAVDDFNLNIASGEFVVFVGPSGCGKSTTLRLIAGLEEDFTGTITIGDRTVNDLPPAQRDIAMVFQNYALYPHMSARQNMAMALKLRKVPKAQIESKVNATAALLGIENLLDRKPGQLSGGQRQRVALGRAIVREPKAFLFDEPLSNLDAKLRVSTRAELKALHRRLAVTSIYVTHDQEEAMTLGDRIVVMAQGRIQQAAPPLEVYRRPVNRFVASFVGTPAMNFLSGKLVADERNPAQLMFVETGARGSALRIPPELSARLSGHLNQDVIAGIRPQHFSEVPRPDSSGLTVLVSSVEPLGEQIDIHGATHAGTTLTARLLARENITPASTLQLHIPAESIHLFAPGDFGANLTL